MVSRSLEGFVIAIKPQHKGNQAEPQTDPGGPAQGPFVLVPSENRVHLPIISRNSGLGPMVVAFCTNPHAELEGTWEVMKSSPVLREEGTETWK